MRSLSSIVYFHWNPNPIPGIVDSDMIRVETRNEDELERLYEELSWVKCVRKAVIFLVTRLEVRFRLSKCVDNPIMVRVSVRW